MARALVVTYVPSFRVVAGSILVVAMTALKFAVCLGEHLRATDSRSFETYIFACEIQSVMLQHVSAWLSLSTCFW